MAERFKATVLKTVEGNSSVGSNPTLSAIHSRLRGRQSNIKDESLEARVHIGDLCNGSTTVFDAVRRGSSPLSPAITTFTAIYFFLDFAVNEVFTNKMSCYTNEKDASSNFKLLLFRE